MRLLGRARRGEETAVNRLVARLLPGLTLWAQGRLPRWARDCADTADIVQESVISVFRRLETFEPRHRGALQSYLRQAIRNRIKDEIRHASRLPRFTEVDTGAATTTLDPLDGLMAEERHRRYSAALGRLPDGDREIVVARLELGYSYEQVALATGRPTKAAARMATRRAILRLAEEMADS